MNSKREAAGPRKVHPALSPSCGSVATLDPSDRASEFGRSLAKRELSKLKGPRSSSLVRFRVLVDHSLLSIQPILMARSAFGGTPGCGGGVDRTLLTHYSVASFADSHLSLLLLTTLLRRGIHQPFY